MTEPKLDGIRLNDQTADNLIEHLQHFRKDAKVTIWYDYKEYDCRICCNFDHQLDVNKVQLMLGNFIQDS